jgi:hypothetical protein
MRALYLHHAGGGDVSGHLDLGAWRKRRDCPPRWRETMAMAQPGAQRFCPSASAARMVVAMPSPVETAVQTYLRSARERDPAARAKLIESCFAETSRIVTRSEVIRGRAGVEEMLAQFLADPDVVGFRVASVIDAAGTTFRFRSIVECRDGTTLEFFDAGEIDGDGRIATLFMFAGPLPDVTT